MKAYAQASPVKTDRRDARLIALAMRAGLYRAVHVKSENSQKVRMALTGRQTVLRQARQLQVKVRGDLRAFGIRLGRVGAGGFAARVKTLLADRPDLWRLVEPLLILRAAALADVAFEAGFTRAPVVLSHSQTVFGGAPIVTRQQSVTAAGAQIRLQEEEAFDGIHPLEDVGYVAIER